MVFHLIIDYIHTGQNYEFIPPEAVGSIEVMRGSASAHYGSDAIGGVVNIQTHRSKDRLVDGSVGTSIGRHDTYAGLFSILSPLSDSAQMTSFLNIEKSEGILLVKSVHRIGQTGYRRLNFFDSIDMALSATTRVYVWFNGVRNEMA